MSQSALAAVLLLGVFIADFSWRWLGAGTRFSTYGLWYILQNLWVVILCVTNVIFLCVTRQTLARDIAIWACCIGAIQGLKDAFCRFLVVDPKQIPAGVDVGDFVTGLPLQTTLVAIYSLRLGWIFYHAHAKHRPG